MVHSQTYIRFLENYPQCRAQAAAVAVAAEKIVDSYRRGGKVLFCGNGGSAADSEHAVGELLKEFKCKRPADARVKEYLTAHGYGELADTLQGGIPAISLVSQTSICTAILNDMGGGAVFAQQVNVYCNPGDVFVGITTSGNSAAVCNAAVTAKAKGGFVVGFTGVSGGKLKALCDVCVAVPETETYRVQELHLPLYHLLCALAEEAVWNG